MCISFNIGSSYLECNWPRLGIVVLVSNQHGNSIAKSGLVMEPTYVALAMEDVEIKK